MSPIPPENLLLMGEVIRPHGLEGLLRIKSYAKAEESFLGAKMVFIQKDSAEPRGYDVTSVRPHKNVHLLKLRGVDSLEEAEKLRGARILIGKETLNSKSRDEYFWHELIGLEVYLSRGGYVGTIKHILPTGSNDIYVVHEGKKEVLIPAINDVIQEIDLTKKRMIISDVEGLLDLNEV
ncbi:MAG: 16S rRNA processing protein RimM [Deltaproteobacteria bacterium]|nr:16S rRNA processing protein RimM [Deltaproteobacteria bacterium]